MSLPSLRVHGGADDNDDDEEEVDPKVGGAAREDAAAEAEAESLAASLRISGPEAPLRRSTQRKGSVILAADWTACSWRSWRFCAFSEELRRERREKGRR